MNRVGAANIAIEQAGIKAEQSVMASDAFFPMPDTVEAAAKAGITAIIQPGGSKRDADSIAVCDQYNIAMVFTNMRHFKHLIKARDRLMNVLIVGRGGREHSLAIHLNESERVKKIYAAPGNGGMEQIATCVSIDEMAIDELVTFAKNKQIDLTIVGPENPLNAGIANRIHEENLDRKSTRLNSSHV